MVLVGHPTKFCNVLLLFIHTTCLGKYWTKISFRFAHKAVFILLRYEDAEKADKKPFREKNMISVWYAAHNFVDETITVTIYSNLRLSGEMDNSNQVNWTGDSNYGQRRELRWSGTFILIVSFSDLINCKSLIWINFVKYSLV